MKNISTWINNYQNLNFDQQYEVAKAIVDSLESKQYYYMQKKEDITKVAAFFNRIIASFKQKSVIEKNKTIIERFERLSQQNKEEALVSIIEIIESYNDKQNQENKEKECQAKGHIFSDWEHKSWIKSVIETDPRWLQEHPTGRYEIECEYWERTCSRCGLVESVDVEPQELVDKREKAERKEEIKRLEMRLKMLKSMDNN